MTARQRARRLLIWRGSFPALAFFTIWMLASAYAGQLTQ